MDAVIFTYTCCFNIPALVILKECSGWICGSLASVSTNCSAFTGHAFTQAGSIP